MKSNNTVPLNEFITLQRGFDLPSKDRIEGVIPVVASTNIVDYHNEAKAKAPGIIIGRSGSIGGGQYIKEDYWPLNTTLWVKDFKGHNPRYIYYVLKNIDFSRFNVGSGVPTLNRNHLSSINIEDIGIIKEKKIAHILSALDDKIELNRKINQTLEEMAQALFKSWFVDFDPVHAKMGCANDEELECAARELGISKEVLELFPSEFEESELGMIPEGWEVKPMQEIVPVKDGTHDSPKPKEHGYPLVTSKHIKNGVIDLDTPKLISKEDFDKVSQRSKVEQFDILIGMIGTIGDLYFVSEKDVGYAIKNIGLFKTSEVKEMSEFIYFWLDTNYMRNHIITRLAGTTQKYISLTELRKLPLIVPNNKLIGVFKELSSSLLSQITSNNEQIQTLQKTRDTLLPKLLSGELGVSNIKTSKEN